MSDDDAKTALAALVMFAVVVTTALLLAWQVRAPKYPDATGIVPQVVSCVEVKPASKPQTVRVSVKPGRKRGRISEYHVLGCTFYYYHSYEDL